MCDDTIHVSSHPVAPSFGTRSLTGALSATSVFGLVRPRGADHDVAVLEVADLLSEPSAQYFLINGFCFLSRLIVALNWVEFSSYGSLIPSDGCVFIRYSAASAIWIGLSGTVILPLYFGL